MLSWASFESIQPNFKIRKSYFPFLKIKWNFGRSLCGTVTATKAALELFRQKIRNKNDRNWTHFYAKYFFVIFEVTKHNFLKILNWTDLFLEICYFASYLKSILRDISRAKRNFKNIFQSSKTKSTILWFKKCDFRKYTVT